jgi:hypothetical protein
MPTQPQHVSSAHGDLVGLDLPNAVVEALGGPVTVFHPQGGQRLSTKLAFFAPI